MLGLVACTGEVGQQPLEATTMTLPDSADEASAVQASGGNSGCYAVKFSVVGDSFGPGGEPIAPFVVSGDLVGTIESVFDLPDSLKFAGVTVKNAGVSYWHITGGVVPNLGEFTTSFDNLNHVIDRPGSPATLFENQGRHRALEGVQKANLTYKGTFNLVPSPFLSHHFKGVICP
jgi:hypothetical protein